MKRIIFVFAAFMCLLTQKVSADVWDGTSVSYSFESGIGTEDSPYIIANSAQFAFFLKQVRSGITYQGKYVLLTADIDMNQKIYNVGGTFAGVFNGGHKTISQCADKIFENLSGTLCNLKYTNPGAQMVHTITTSGLVYNMYVGIHSVPIDNADTPGMICHTNNGRIQNCYVFGVNNSTFTYGSLVESHNISMPGTYDDDEINVYNAFANINNGYIENCCNDIKNGSIHHLGGRYTDPWDDIFKTAYVYVNNGTISNCYSNVAVNYSNLNNWVYENGGAYSLWLGSTTICPLEMLNNSTCTVVFTDPYFGYQEERVIPYYSTITDIPYPTGNATFLGWLYKDKMVDRTTYFEQDAIVVAQWKWNIQQQPTNQVLTTTVDDVEHAEYTWRQLSDYANADDWTSKNKGQNNTSDSIVYTFNTKYVNYQLHFNWGVSADSYDKLTIELDGNTLVSKAGKNSGTYTGVIDEKGSHTLKVKYQKDISGSLNQDCGWIQDLYVYSQSLPMANTSNTLSASDVSEGNAYYCIIGYTNNPTILTTNIVSFSQPIESSKTPYYDVNNDGKVDIQDVTTLVNYILKK